jgi:hypothetical protein
MYYNHLLVVEYYIEHALKCGLISPKRVFQGNQCLMVVCFCVVYLATMFI